MIIVNSNPQLYGRFKHFFFFSVMLLYTELHLSLVSSSQGRVLLWQSFTLGTSLTCSEYLRSYKLCSFSGYHFCSYSLFAVISAGPSTPSVRLNCNFLNNKLDIILGLESEGIVKGLHLP